MADQRVSQSIRISDATTPTQQVAINSSGQMSVIVAAALPAGANVIGAVTQSGTWTVTTNADSVVTGGTAPSKALLIAAQYNSSLPTYTTGQVGAIQLDSSGRILVGALSTGAATIGAVTQASGPWTVNVTQIAGSSIATAASGIIKVGLTDASGTSITLGSALSASSVPVVIASDQASIPVTVGSPTSPIGTALTTSAVAAGSSSTLTYTGTSSTFQSIYLWQIDASCSVAFKAVVQSVANAVATTQVVLFGQAGQNIRWLPPSEKFVEGGTGAAQTNGFQVVMTNLDESLSADVYSTIWVAKS